jgi:hypothetical protein
MLVFRLLVICWVVAYVQGARPAAEPEKVSLQDAIKVQHRWCPLSGV